MFSLHWNQLKKGVFVGKDQTLYNWIALMYPEYFFVVPCCMPNSFKDSDWFYFEKWYALDNERDDLLLEKEKKENEKQFYIQRKVRNMTDFLNEGRLKTIMLKNAF